MSSFLISKTALPNDSIALSEKESQHLRDVLRISRGEKVKLFDGNGFEYEAQVNTISKKSVSVTITNKKPLPPPKGTVKIAQALLKHAKMEFVIQKAAELGANSFQPFVSSRTIVRLTKNEKLHRWQKIADEAIKQCGRGTRMTIEPVVTFQEMIQKTHADLKIILWEEETRPSSEILKSIKDNIILTAIGPEGGFSKDEIQEAKEKGFVSLSLGKNILRAETAAIVVLSLIQYELGNLT